MVALSATRLEWLSDEKSREAATGIITGLAKSMLASGEVVLRILEEWL